MLRIISHRQAGCLMLYVNKFLVAILGGVLVLAGCSSSTKTAPLVSEPDIVTVKLAMAADKAAMALDNIAGIERQRGPAVPAEDYSSAPSNMMRPVTIRWSGPLDQIVRTLADRAGVRFRVKGRVPAAAIVVNVDVYQTPILHVLRDIGLQIGRRADLRVDGASGFVEVRYASADKLR